MQDIKIRCSPWPDFGEAPECEEILRKAPLVLPRAVSSLFFLPSCHLYKCLCKCSAQHDRLHLLHASDILSKFSDSVPSMNSLGDREAKGGVRNTAGGTAVPVSRTCFQPLRLRLLMLRRQQGFAWPQVQSGEPFSAEPDLPTSLALASLT